MSTKTLRWLLVAGLALAASFGSVARADVDNASATNVQEGDNDTETNQSGSAESGDAVAGQVTGVVSSGDTSVDATNRSEDVDVETGDASGENSAANFTGLTAGSDTLVAADILNGAAVNVQEGDNETEVTQAAEAASGDGVGGQVIGVVTSAGGSADVVAANTSEDVDAETGEAEAFNDAASFVGLNGSGVTFTAADILNASATNVQEGDNDLTADQSADSASGDAVGGSVLGVVSAGDASVDATNRSEDVDADTGDADATNSVAAFVGLTAGSDTVTTAADILNGAAANVQEGDNEAESVQAAEAGSGDAVAGQVAGVVTSAGGSADLVLANTSEDSDGETGDSEFDNFDTSFTGLNASGVITVF
jgi:HAMP domain-containing protein